MVDFRKLPLMPVVLACVCAALAGQGIYVLTASAAQQSAEDSYIKFIPSDQALENRAWSNGTHGILLHPIRCKEDLANKNAQCETCNAMRYSCPDCCLVQNETSGAMGKACDWNLDSAANKPRYSCEDTAPFEADKKIQDANQAYDSSGNYLTKICRDNDVPHAQELGCKYGTHAIPTYTSRPKAECNWVGTGHWFCLQKTQEPDQPFRLPLMEDSTLGKRLRALIDARKVYDIEEYEHDEGPNPCPRNKDKCWEYKARDDFWDFCDTCIDAAREWEACLNRISCCLLGLSKDTYNAGFPTRSFYKCPCAPPAPTGTEQTVNKQCASCDKRIIFDNECKVDGQLRPGCVKKQCLDTYTQTNCEQWTEEYRLFLLGDSELEVQSFVSTCFKPIVSNFYYKFVPKSNEKFLLQWQIFCQSKAAGDRTDRGFYTMIKVYKEDDFLKWRDERGLSAWTEPAPKHISLVHQKSFSGDFTITSSTFLDSGAEDEFGEPVFETGAAYAAVICYSIPRVNDEVLDMLVSAMNFVVFRHRD